MQVFISHASKDDAVVAELRAVLKELGVGVWDDELLKGGDGLQSSINAAIDASTYFLAVLSPVTIASTWVHREIRYALKAGKSIVPILLPGMEPRSLGIWFDDEPKALNLVPGSVSDALTELRAALGLDAGPIESLAAPVADLILELGDPAIDTSDGRRRATAIAELKFYPPDKGRVVEGSRFRFTAPLGPIETEELAWYLERYSNWPSGVFQERAARVEEMLPRWGRLLHDALPAGDDAITAWFRPQDAERRFTIKVDKSLVAPVAEARQAEADEAATLLLALPWELIHDGNGFLFQGTNGVRVRRSLPNRKPQPEIAAKPPIRVLLVSPRPADAGYIDHRASALPLAEALSKLGDLAEFKILSPPTFQALEEELRTAAPYHVVHFDGHGVYDRKNGLGNLCFEHPDDRSRSDLVNADRIAGIVQYRRVPLFFLDACQTAVAADDPSSSVAGKLLECGVASVAAMSHSVLVETARRFVTVFYQELMVGKRVGQAMLAGQRALKNDAFRGKVLNVDLRLEDWFVPVLFQEQDDPQLIRSVPAKQMQESIAAGLTLALGEVPAPPEHGFIGRSRELLKAERLLETERYIVLQGEGGEGKTTLAAELARWLVLSRRFERSAFVPFDKVPDARAALWSIGAQLVPNYLSLAGQDAKLARQLVERALADHATVIVLDNMETILPPAPDSPALSAFEPKTLEEIAGLCKDLGPIGKTRLIFTSREALPEPFSRNMQPVGSLERHEAIRLVSRVLGEGILLPGAADAVESEREIKDLVDAVGCHARALVLLAGEVAASGVRGATGKVHELMAALEKKYPGQRERSLLASVELSLRRLPAETRSKIRGLGVFQGGGSAGVIALALGVQPDEGVKLVQDLVAAGLAEKLGFSYVRFDPALAPALLAEMSAEERATARTAWSEAMAELTLFLYQQQFKNVNFARNLARLDLPNLVTALEYLTVSELAERTVEIATSLESLISDLGHSRALSRVVEIRSSAAGRLGAWSHAQYLAESATVDRLLWEGRLQEAIYASRSLFEKTTSAGEDAYNGAPYDLAMVHMRVGRALSSGGAAEEAVPIYDEARERFVKLGKTRMANVALVEKADCLTDLGRHEEAADAYEESIQIAEETNDTRQVAVNRGQLASVRIHQRRYDEALTLYAEARITFEQLGEPATAAQLWHQIGVVHEQVGHYEAAETAYQESLKIKVQIGDQAGEAKTLSQLGNLYSELDRREDAVRFYRHAVEIAETLNDTRSEGLRRANLANELVKLRQYDEARAELLRAIKCKKPFGHVAEPWRTFDILCNLERAVENEPAARGAKNQATQAYLAYRRDGGESQTQRGQLFALVAHQPDAAKGRLAELRQRQDLPAWLTALIPALEGVLAGSRDNALAEDPNLNYDDAAELLFLIESLLKREQVRGTSGGLD